MMAKKKLLITRYGKGILTGLLLDGKFVEISYEPDREASLLDAIYVGRVSKMLKNVNACFVDIGIGQDCFFSMEDNPTPLFVKKYSKESICVGDEFLVQVVKEAQKNKLPTVSSILQWKGRTMILTLGKGGVGISHKITGERREELSRFFADAVAETGGSDEDALDCDLPWGVIVRTNAQDAGEDDLLREWEELTERMKQQIRTWVHAVTFHRVDQPEPSYISFLKNTYRFSYEEILTDDADIHAELMSYIRRYQPEDLPKLTLYEDPYPLEKLYSIEHQVSLALSPKVWLNSGAYIMIEHTEALTVIDVNSAKNVDRYNKKENHLRINKEAAVEIAKQLRLRNISGIIVIDFIDVSGTTQEMIEFMKNCVKNDPVPTSVIDMTGLSLMELTRKKIRKPLSEQMKYSE